MGKPMPLLSNKGKSFQGSIVLGKGFVLSTEKAKELIKKDSRNRDVLFPYLNGDDLNNDPEQKPSRWVINFFDWDEEKAKTYPDCYEIIEKLVKPERQRWKKDNQNSEIVGTYALRKPLPQKWWIYGEKRPALYNAISELDQVMVIPNQACKYVAFQIVPSKSVFSNALAVITDTSNFLFSVLSSNFHNEWAWKYASKMKADMRYTPTDVFETFPLPKNILNSLIESIENIGKEFNLQRKNVMAKYAIGLTKLYNFIHKNPSEGSALTVTEFEIDIVKLRSIMIKLDNQLLKVYGWDDLNLCHDFYEMDYLPENDRVRFTIHPTARKEILNRLLLLNLEESKSDILYKTVNKRSKIVSKTLNTLFPED